MKTPILVREILDHSQLSQSELARRAGLTPNRVSDYLAGRHEASARVLDQLASASGLELTVASMFAREALLRDQRGLLTATQLRLYGSAGLEIEELRDGVVVSYDHLDEYDRLAHERAAFLLAREQLGSAALALGGLGAANAHLLAEESELTVSVVVTTSRLPQIDGISYYVAPAATFSSIEGLPVLTPLELLTQLGAAQYPGDVLGDVVLELGRRGVTDAELDRALPNAASYLTQLSGVAS